VIGQHGGDLFVHFSSKSSKQLGLLGFIVQGTNVSISTGILSDIFSKTQEGS
jgi:hypothetical protein